MAKRNSKKKWLFEEYKAQHPELYGRSSKRIIMKDALRQTWYTILPVIIFVILNIIAILMMIVLNEDIRGWII